MSPKVVYLITGANRGIGFGLTAVLAGRPSTIVFAGARDPTAQSLKDLAAKHPNVHVVKLTSGDKTDNEAAIAQIQKTAGQLDVIIANAGISKYYGPLATTPISEFHDHYSVNAIGPVVLFQAAHALLLASPAHAPIFAVISSVAGSISRYYPLHAAAYGASKAAANFLVKVLDDEHPSLVALAIHPGWVGTDMGNMGAVASGMPHAPVRVEDSVAGILSRVDGATREKSSGRFWNFGITEGNSWDLQTDEVPW
ncbi:aflatoxin biosynthesis ketoreductase nor-1 [Mycena capillaripes]|nr:aflatoxin biosynthesis ketoreductase nor-1 [Mycena capillaripes]